MEMLSIVQNPWVILAVLAWSLPWKGAALWKAARKGSHGWFIALLLVNTLAILDIIYIYFIHKDEHFETDPGQEENN